MNTNLATVSKMRDDFEIDRIKKFIEIKSMRSKRTPEEYLRDITHFFKFATDKDIQFIRTPDLMISKDTVYDYVIELMNNGLKKVTALRKLAAVKSFYTHLQSVDYPVNPSWFKIEELTNDAEGYDALTWEEVERFIEIVKPTRKGKMKALLIETAVRTSFRFEALMGLTVDSLEMKDGVWTLKTIEVRDKGDKVNQIAIPSDLRDRLLEQAEENKKDKKIKEGRFFALTKKSVRKMIEDCCKEMGIDRTKRRIVFHSFKSAGITEVFIVSGGDLQAVKEQGHHESVKTSLEHYVKLQQDFSKSASLLMGQKVDEQLFENLSSEQWMDMFKQLDRATQLKMQSILKGGI